eukprot:351729-Chlamydomonas_euryale.AAC.8
MPYPTELSRLHARFRADRRGPLLLPEAERGGRRAGRVPGRRRRRDVRTRHVANTVAACIHRWHGYS